MRSDLNFSLSFAEIEIGKICHKAMVRCGWAILPFQAINRKEGIMANVSAISISTSLHDTFCSQEGRGCDGCSRQSVGGFCEQPASRRLFITNAFSLSMLDDTSLWMDGRLAIRRLSENEARQLLSVCTEAGYRIVSGVGHVDTARIFSGILGTEVPMNRINIDLSGLDLLLVGQYSGPRLPEGTTELPSGATIRWFTVQDVSVFRQHDARLDWEKQSDPEREGCFRPLRKKLADFLG